MRVNFSDPLEGKVEKVETIQIIEENFSEELEKLMEREYAEEEKKHGVCCRYTPFCFTASEQGSVIGIITGYTCYEEVYIDDLIVIKNHRGKGVGTRLVEAVEERFEGRGFNNINLCTNGFQAPDFYEKCGYKLEYIRENKRNPKLNKYFYVKYINA